MFFRKKKEEPSKRANAILYPDKIVIGTWNNSGGEIFTITDNVTILDTTSSEKELGLYIKKHLQESIFQDSTKEELSQIRNNYKKKLRAKTEKILFENAKCVAVKLEGPFISFNSYKTKTADKMFLGNPPSIVSFNSNISDEQLGEEIRNAWKKCDLI